MEESPQEPLLELLVDHDTGNVLRETAKWTKFISIVGIVGIAVCTITLLAAGNLIIESYSKVFPDIGAYKVLIFIIVFVFILLFGFMVYLLFRFSQLIRKGIETQDQAVFNQGLNSLKIYFTIAGVIAIISLIGNFLRLI